MIYICIDHNQGGRLGTWHAPLHLVICCDQQLAEGEAAVVGGYLFMEEGVEAAFCQQGDCLVQQQLILPHTAAESNGVAACLFADRQAKLAA